MCIRLARHQHNEELLIAHSLIWHRNIYCLVINFYKFGSLFLQKS